MPARHQYGAARFADGQRSSEAARDPRADEALGFADGSAGAVLQRVEEPADRQAV